MAAEYPASKREAFRDHVRSIAFDYVQPHARFPSGLGAALAGQLLARAGYSIDAYNARGGTGAGADGDPLLELCRIPRASTYALGKIIQRGVSLMADDEVFLNVGVWHGFTFLSGLAGNRAKRCIGVDRFCVHEKLNGRGQARYRGLERGLHRLNDALARRAFLRNFRRYRSNTHRFYEMDYVHYLTRVHRERIGFYIYDAQHRYVDQMRGLTLAEPFFSDDCILFIDDTNAEDNRRATLDFIEHSEHDYEVLLDVSTAGNRHPTFWNGVMVLQRTG